MIQPGDHATTSIRVPSGTAQSTKPPPAAEPVEPFLPSDIGELRRRWAAGGPAKEKMLRNMGGLLFSLLLVATLHIAIALME